MKNLYASKDGDSESVGLARGVEIEREREIKKGERKRGEK